MRIIRFPAALFAASCLLLRTSCVLAVSSFGALGGDSEVNPLEKVAGAQVPRQWVQVQRSRWGEIFEMLAAQMKGNYERIRTWRGTYLVHTRARLGVDEAALLLQANLKRPVDCPFVQDNLDTLDFAIDLEGNRIYRWPKPVKLTWIEEKSQQRFSFPDLSPIDERSIVTAAEYLHFDGKVHHARFKAVPDVPEAQNTRAAFRDPPADARRRSLGDLMDPRRFYGPDDARKFWDILQTDVGNLKGERGPELQKAAETRLRVHEASTRNGSWYRVDTELDGPGGTTDTLSIIYCPAAGFYPVKCSFWREKVTETPFETTEWQWERFGEIYVPVTVRIVLNNGAYQRDVVLQRCALNEPIDASQFSYAGLGMQDGDLVMDRIEGICYVLDGGKPRKLADFNAEYLPTRGKVRIWLRRALIGLEVVAVLAIAIFLAVKLRRKAAT